MNATSPTPSGAESVLIKAWNLLTAPIAAATASLVAVLAEIVKEARARPMTWSAIFTLAGVLSFMAGQYHLGAIFISCFGMLWMWLDAIDNPLDEKSAPDVASA